MPSRKFIIIFLIILLLGAGSFWLLKDRDWQGSNKFVFEREKDLTPVLFQQNNKDSDNDGLSDWEEVLWKTNPNNPDTDGDGTTDGEEIKQGRDPLKPGPNDKYSAENFAAATSTALVGTADSNETEKLSQEFISQYLAYKVQGGASLDQASKDKLITSLLNGLDLEIIPPYTIGSIKISTDNSQESLKNYASQLEIILSKYVNPPPSMEVYIFKDMVDKKDESMVKELDKSVATYEGLRKDCLNLTAPSDLKNQHLKLVNSFALLKGISEKFSNHFNDPLGSLIAFEQYPTVAMDMANSVIDIRNYLKSKSISFKF